MNNLDYIYYTATTSDPDDPLGTTTITYAQYYVPFIDFLIIAITFTFTILFLQFGYKMLYEKKKLKINIWK